jgi:hypothetical protein
MKYNSPTQVRRVQANRAVTIHRTLQLEEVVGPREVLDGARDGKTSSSKTSCLGVAVVWSGGSASGTTSQQSRKIMVDR